MDGTLETKERERVIAFSQEEIEQKIKEVFLPPGLGSGKIEDDDFNAFMVEVVTEAKAEYDFLNDMEARTIFLILQTLNIAVGKEPAQELTANQAADTIIMQKIAHRLYEELKKEKAS